MACPSNPEQWIAENSCIAGVGSEKEDQVSLLVQAKLLHVVKGFSIHKGWVLLGNCLHCSWKWSSMWRQEESVHQER